MSIDVDEMQALQRLCPSQWLEFLNRGPIGSIHTGHLDLAQVVNVLVDDIEELGDIDDGCDVEGVGGV